MPFKGKQSGGYGGGSGHVCSEGDTFQIKVSQISGASNRITLNWECWLQCLRSAVQSAFEVPLVEQRLLIPSGDDTTELIGSDMQSLLQLGIDENMVITLLRQDSRTTSDKNCALLDALVEHRLDDALEVVNSFGFPVDPNCVYHWRCGKGSCMGLGRACLDVKERNEQCLGLAIRARNVVWDGVGIGNQISREGASEELVIPVVQELLKLKADVNGVAEEVHSQGSWGGEGTDTKTPLFLACETGSPGLVQILLEARADVQFESATHAFGTTYVSMMRAANGNSKIIDLLKAFGA